MIDPACLRSFEERLDPSNLGLSGGASLLGCGEISAVFALEGDPDVACKRMPLFSSAAAAQGYADLYRRYVAYLREAGLELPEDDTCVVEMPGRPVVLYIAQKRLPPEVFGHALVHRLDERACRGLLDAVGERIARVFAFNERRRPRIELAIDGQLSNWALLEDGRLLFVDTSTPLHRLDGIEQLDPELFLASAPGSLRWLLRLAFLDEVMGRYYSPRRVYLDLVANLHKEKREDLVPLALEAANGRIQGEEPLTVDEVRTFYAADRRIWSVFQAFRRFDRWLKRSRGSRYEFVLPERIAR